MRTLFVALALTAMLSPAVAMAAPAAAQHSVRGVVKSVTDSSLVIERSKKAKPHDLSFVMNPATQRAGAVTVGSTVSVRYHKDGHTNVATAVNASPAAAHALKTKK